MRKTVRCAVLLLTVPWVMSCGTVSSFTEPPKYGEHACTVIIGIERNPITEAIVIVGEHINTEEWLVVFVSRDSYDFVGVDGKVRSVNIPKAKVLRQGERRIINGVMCHCP